MMIDFHCHLDLYPNPNKLVNRIALEDFFVLSVTTTPSAFRGTLALASGNPNIRTALGLHPQLASERHRELVLFDELLPSVPWVGEVGLDGSPECRPFWDIQEHVFSHILRSCTAIGGRLLSIHSRRATTQVLHWLSQFPDSGTHVLHWFSGTQRELLEAIKMQCWFSVGLPMLTSMKGRALVSQIPRNRVLTETDGPFTEVDRRPSTPLDIHLAVRELSQLWDCPPSEVSEILRNNLQSIRERHCNQ